MKCIKCGSETQVANSRPRSKTPSVWRRRSCKSCGLVFTTEESVSEAEFQVVIRDESTQEAPFSFARLLISIYDAMPSRVPEKAPEEAFWLTTTIAQEIQATATDKVSKKELVELTYEVLNRYDPALGMSYGIRHGALTAVRSARPGRPTTKRRS